MAAKIDLLSIKDLKDYSFFIPRYQRGYRWDSTQVKDLIEDIQEFIDKEKKGIYCVQPLVVQQRMVNENGRNKVWEVIDGQQRLTTISIILQVIDKQKPYTITYEVLSDEQGHRNKVNDICPLSELDGKSDINLHHMIQCRDVVSDWFDGVNDIIKDKFVSTLNDRVKFIWYENENESPIKIFTRLNIGRIALTNSELIKALFLNRDNFCGSVTAQQLAIAQQWDNIETALQNDEFWLFFNRDYKSYDKPTRIDYLFDYLCDQKMITGYDDIIPEERDEYRTFRYFYQIYQSDEKKEVRSFLNVWDQVRDLFGILNEWYSDIKLYHYVGYVVFCNSVSLSTLIEKWNIYDKVSFVNEFLFGVINQISLAKCKDLKRVYPINRKTESRPLLLLHNIQKIVNQNRLMLANEKYSMAAFYKFPFHLMIKENWNVEHIDSSTENNLDGKSQESYILATYSCLSGEQQKDKVLQELLISFFEGDDTVKEDSFRQIMSKMENALGWRDSGNNDNWKNTVWNYTLLDETTNKSYKNAIFPVKRLHIIGKENGILRQLHWDKEIHQVVVDKPKQAKSAFVPLVTKEVFQKTYSIQLGNLSRWDDNDAEAYLHDIEEVLTKAPMDVKDSDGKMATFNFLA